MRKQNSLLEKAKNNQTVVGTWSMTGSTTVAEILSCTELDFIILDMEHASMSFETIENQVRAIEVRQNQAIVRVSNSDPQTMLRALETGCRGIMVPHVSSVAEAEAVVQACRYAPAGRRGLSPYTRNHLYSHHNLADSLATENQNTFVGILVEGIKGIENIGDIAQVPGIDLIYTGIYDISQSAGLPGQIDHPDVLALQKKCVDLINAGQGAMPGSFANSVEYAEILSQLGYKFIAYCSDGFLLKGAVENAINNLKSI